MSDSVFATYLPLEHGLPATDLTVHAAHEGDLAAISSVASACECRTERLIETTAARIADPDAVIVIAASAAHGTVGWSGVTWWQGGDGAPAGWYVCGLMVAPAARRRGAGAALLAACVKWAEPRGELWSTCNSRNRASIATHERAGFVAERHGPRFGSLVFDGGDGVLLHRLG